MTNKAPIQIAFFNHKGGVAKTTSAFHIGWKLAELGKKVLMVDCDPQCNLTGLVLTYSGQDEYRYASEDGSPRNILEGLTPVFDGRPVKMSAVRAEPVPDRENLYILPGHVGFAELESQLAISHELSSSLSIMRNLPGSISWLFSLSAREIDADYIIVDMSPSLGAINQNLLMTSDAFIIPVAPDFFSAMALRSLSRVLPRWTAWSKQASTMPVLSEASYPWPSKTPRYLGAIVQNYRVRSREGKPAAPTRAYDKWFDELKQTKAETLLPKLSEIGLLLGEDDYISSGASTSQFLLEVPDFNSLIATAQDHSKPVFTLSKGELESSGVVLETQMKNVKKFNKTYQLGAEKISKLCGML